MKINPLSIVGGILGLAIKWIVLLAVSLFVYDLIKFRKEVKKHV